MIALVLEPFQRLDDLGELRTVEREPELRCFHREGRLAGELGDDEPRPVADAFWIDVLVRVGALRDRARVQARLVRERRVPDVRGLRVERHVDELGDVMRDRREPVHAIPRNRLDSHLEREIRDDRREVAVTGALAVPVDGALHLFGAAADAGERVGDARTGVVVQVDRDFHVVAEVRDDFAHDALDLVGQGTAVGVAQDEMGRTLRRGFFEHAERELRVALVAVEEMLGVEEHLHSGVAQELDRVPHHGDTFVQRRAECFGDVIVPGLADDADGADVRLHEMAERVVAVDLALDATRRPEGDQRRCRQLKVVRRAPEQLVVLRVRARPARLDVVDAEPVQLFGDAQLVLNGERDALELRAVPKCRVVDLDAFGSHSLRPGIPGPRALAAPGEFASLTALSDFFTRHVRTSPCTCRPGRALPSRTRPR